MDSHIRLRMRLDWLHCVCHSKLCEMGLSIHSRTLILVSLQILIVIGGAVITGMGGAVQPLLGAMLVFMYCMRTNAEHEV